MADEKYITVPNQITQKSFEIIQAEIDKIDPNYTFKSPVEEQIIKRAIHTTADFDYMHSLRFTHDAIKRIRHAIMNHGTIITDTTMALAGINKCQLDNLGVDYRCFIRDSEVHKLANEKGITRSMEAIEVAAKLPGEKVFVVGNAPTALYKILEMIREKRLKVAAVIGVPVGFVEAKESKDDLANSDVPAIVAIGRKGGSNLAAALTNAILYNLDLIK